MLTKVLLLLPGLGAAITFAYASTPLPSPSSPSILPSSSSSSISVSSPPSILPSSPPSTISSILSPTTNNSLAPSLTNLASETPTEASVLPSNFDDLATPTTAPVADGPSSKDDIINKMPIKAVIGTDRDNDAEDGDRNSVIALPNDDGENSREAVTTSLPPSSSSSPAPTTPAPAQDEPETTTPLSADDDDKLPAISAITPTTNTATNHHSDDDDTDNNHDDNRHDTESTTESGHDSATIPPHLATPLSHSESPATVAKSSLTGRSTSAELEREAKDDKDDEEDEEEEEEKDKDREDEEEDENEIAENICTAEYFIDRVVPEDYPQPVEKTVKHINETIERINRLYKFSGKILQNFNPLIREMGSRIMDFFYEAQIEPHCLGSFVRIIRGIQARRQWAVSFIDATGSVITGGFQEGRFVSFGEFEQCIAIESKSEDEMIAGQPIRGQYCMVKPVIPLPDSVVRGENIIKPEVEIMNRVLSDQYIETYLGLFRYMKNTILKLGLCLPANCKAQEIENALNKFFIRKSGLSIQIGPRCVTAHDPIEIDSYQAISIFMFSLVSVLILTSTIFELIHRLMSHVELDSASLQLPLTHGVSKRICTPTSFSEPKSIFSTVRFQRQASTMSSAYTEKPVRLQILTMFSLIRNTRVLFDSPASGRKTSIDTIRLLLIIFFFVSNAYIYTIIFAPMLLKRFYVIGPLQLLNDKKYFFIRMYYMINCFVTISGIGMVLNYRPKRFQYFQFISITYLRYAVPILFTIGAIYIIPLLNSGPMWSQFNDTITESCRHSFWPTVLFYNNFNYNVETVCNFPTVFISLIFQLKLVAPLIVGAIFTMSTRRIFTILSILFALSMALNLSLRFYFGIKIPHEYSQMESFSEIKHSVMFFNFNPLTYMSTLIFGIAVGFLLKLQVKFRHIHVLSFGFTAFVLFIIGIVYMENMDMSKIGMFTLVSILAWGRVPMLSFVSWIIYAAEERHIVMTKRFLSSVVWYPLCQLSYGFYISSLIVNGYRLFSIEENITLAPQVMFRAIVSDAVIAFLFSYLIHVFVIQPMKNLRYVLLRCPFTVCGINVGSSSYECSDAKACSVRRPKELRFCNGTESSTCSSPSDLQNNNHEGFINNDQEDCKL